MEQLESGLIERCIESELIYDGKVVHLYVDRVALPDGSEGVREYVRHIGAVAVLLFVIGQQPYAAVFAFSLLVIKASVLLKRV